MKVINTISAVVLTSTILLGGTACASNNDPNGAAGAGIGQETQAATEATDKQEEQNVETTKTQVVSTVNAMLSYLSDETKFNALVDTSDSFTENTPREEIAQILLEEIPEGFSFFASNDTDTIEQAYVYMSELVLYDSISADGNQRYFTEGAVTVNGDTAKVYGGDLQTIYNHDGGEIDKSEKVDKVGMDSVDPQNPHPRDYINLVKKDGKWLIVPPALGSLKN